MSEPNTLEEMLAEIDRFNRGERGSPIITREFAADLCNRIIAIEERLAKLSELAMGSNQRRDT